MLFPAMSRIKTPGDPTPLIKQGAKLTATWEDVWEDLPSQVRLALEDFAEAQAQARGESQPGETASLFDSAPGNGSSSAPMSDHERAVFQLLRADDPLQMDELLERLDGELASGEVFTALFELELAGRIRQMPGKNYLRTM